MAQQLIGVGSAPNDTTGDPLRTAFQKCNSNFTELYERCPQHGRLTYVSTTQIKFAPYGGDQIKIQGVLYTIPSSGITANNTSIYRDGTAGQNLSAGGTYLVCLFNNAGTLTIDFRTTLTHSADTTAGNVGVESPSADRSRTVIGMVYCTTGAAFTDTQAFRSVISWFNRRNLSLAGLDSAGFGTSSTSFIEFNSGCRAYFLNWAEEDAHVGVSGSILSASVGTAGIKVGVDGSSVGEISYTTIGTNGWWANGAAFTSISTTEGLHYITPMGASASGTSMTFYVACYGMIRG